MCYLKSMDGSKGNYPLKQENEGNYPLKRFGGGYIYSFIQHFYLLSILGWFGWSVFRRLCFILDKVNRKAASTD